MHVHTHMTNWHIHLYPRDVDAFDESTGTKHVAHIWNDKVTMKLDEQVHRMYVQVNANHGSHWP